VEVTGSVLDVCITHGEADVVSGHPFVLIPTRIARRMPSAIGSKFGCDWGLLPFWDLVEITP